MSLIEKSIVLFIAVVSAAGCSQTSWYSRRPMNYPEAYKSGVTDTFHGVRVSDPFRWLEDPDSKETRAWIKAQNDLTCSWLEEVPVREKIWKRMIQLSSYEKYGLPVKRGGRYFFSRSEGTQRRNAIYWTESIDGEPMVLLDPNTLSKTGFKMLSGYSISRDGRWMAYGLSSGASNSTDWYVHEIDTGRKLADHLRCAKHPNLSWDSEGTGFYYSRPGVPGASGKLPQYEHGDKLYYHRLGTDQSDDRLVFGRTEQKERRCSGTVTDDGRYLVISVSKRAEPGNVIFYKRIGCRNGGIIGLITKSASRFRFVDNDGPIFWFLTDSNAPRGRVIAVDIRKPAGEYWRTVIPETEDVLQEVNVVNNAFVASYLKDTCSLVKLYDLGGQFLRDLELPGMGTVRGFDGKRCDTETFFCYESFVNPGTIYRCDLDSGKSEICHEPKLDIDPERFVTRQAFCTSKDGSRVSMFITHKKGLKRDGGNHAMLVVYGGFNAAMTPYFAAT